MASQYLLSDIIKYELITKQYCESEGGFTLSVEELIHLAALEKKFNTDYARYLIIRCLNQISDYISQKALGKGFQVNVKNNVNLREDIKNNNFDISNYDNWLKFYEDKTAIDDPDIYDIIDQILKDNNWHVLYYLYYKEEEKLYNFLFNEKNKLNDRKFFIIQ